MKYRNSVIKEIRKTSRFDVVVIGGGASGIGAALEACLRGYKTLLLEKHDFTKGTSSRSTKLIHGGVRYMAQGDLKMVREALKERGYLMQNAPHLVHGQPFIIPNYRWWEGIFYTVGLKFYDLLSGRFSLGKSVHLKRDTVLKLLPGISQKGLRGGVLYHDGQFDDSRLAVDLLHELFANGGLALNYAEVMALEKENNQVSGVVFRDVAGKPVPDTARKAVGNLVETSSKDEYGKVRTDADGGDAEEGEVDEGEVDEGEVDEGNIEGGDIEGGNIEGAIAAGDANREAGNPTGDASGETIASFEGATENALVNELGGKNFIVKAGVVINATGVWVDEIMKMDRPGHRKMIRPSQGVHLVIDKSFLPGYYALMIPKTSDGRVLFAVPWHGHLVVGTTDTPIDSSSEEPVALEEEIRFILGTATEYLEKPVESKDVLSVFAGLRPLAAPRDGSSKTKEISRNHKIMVSDSKLITVIGGKWTTYRKMGQDMIDTAVSQGLLNRSESQTKSFRILNSGTHEPDNDKRGTGLRDAGERGNGNPAADDRGADDRGADDRGADDRGTGHYGIGDHGMAEGDTVSRFPRYGDHAGEIAALVDKEPALGVAIHRDLPYTWAEVEWICRNEMVVHLEDLMARRLRAVFL
ncbi:MAG: glycerol-3-phosphate dehydrogenase/oxidase, partial [Bacteroidales bacterium]